MFWVRTNFCSGQIWWHEGIKHSFLFPRTTLMSHYVLLTCCHRVPGSTSGTLMHLNSQCPTAKQFSSNWIICKQTTFVSEMLLLLQENTVVPGNKTFYSTRKTYFQFTAFILMLPLIYMYIYIWRKGMSLFPVQPSQSQPLGHFPDTNGLLCQLYSNIFMLDGTGEA